MQVVEKVNQAFEEELNKVEKELLDTVDVNTYLSCKAKLFVMDSLARKIGVDEQIISKISGKLK